MNSKHTFVALAAFGCLSAAHIGAANASIVTFTGDTTGGPTFQRALGDLTDLSGVGTSVAYSTYEFTVDVSGDYTFLTTAKFDPVTFLYGPSFDPANALVNALYGNDDLQLNGDNSPTTSGFAASLDAGASYVFVGTGFRNDDAGMFSTTVGGPGAIALSVPEPETYAMMALGLGVLGFARRYAGARSV